MNTLGEVAEDIKALTNSLSNVIGTERGEADLREIFENIKRINQEMDTTLLIVEQNAKIALEISTYAYIMESGKIVLEGASAELKNNPDVKEFYIGVRSEASRKGYQRWQRPKA